MNEIIETTRPGLMELLHRKSELEYSIKIYKKVKDKPTVQMLRKKLFLLEIQIKYEVKNDKQNRKKYGTL
jgi:hypothetical protein|tara:strand:+ start:757 stop:966 length:210 start_codon:yes stop_codon:yes gene_type:complete